MNGDVTSGNGERHILIAVDDSENAMRAVLYAGDFLGGSPGFAATLIHVIPEPPAEYFETEDEREGWIGSEREAAESLLGRCRQVLIQSGFAEDKVNILVEPRQCPSVADCILEAQRRLGCCTVVMGRRGISKKEEFLYGSTSSRIVHAGRNCAVWIVE